MIKAAIFGLALAVVGGSAVQAAPFATIAFRKGDSALVYDAGSVSGDAARASAWVYQILHNPMDGATLIATYRQFDCIFGRTRDVSRRFATPKGETLRAVEAPDEWQEVETGSDRAELLRQVCTGKPGRIAGDGLSVFAFQDVVLTALKAGVGKSGAK
ncbi:hypothetical protein [Phenylobacterium sp.]|uniref:hypothetical protein n=1 Tax=Phenylobacterium sp. TaxID=1871053 RepID=UPI00286ADB4F|nr:hypothetical protein [Phenylobacterium sp.]